MSQAPGIEYRFPPRFVARWALSALLRRRRVLARDARRLLAGREPFVEGDPRLAAGRCILVMNHYERPGLPVWWAAIAVSEVVAGQAPGVVDPCWIITNRFYRFRLFGRLRIPARVVGWVLGLVARTYGLVTIERRREGVARRTVALRRMRRLLDGDPPRPVAATPEAEYGGGVALGEPYPSSGKALAWLSRGGVPIVPVGVSERDGRLVLRFGAPFVLDWPGLPEARRRREALAAHVMSQIAAVLPPEQRGRWATSGVEGLEGRRDRESAS